MAFASVVPVIPCKKDKQSKYSVKKLLAGSYYSQVGSLSFAATYVKFNGMKSSVNDFAGTDFPDRLPVPTRKFVSRSNTLASMWLNFNGKKLLPVSTWRSRFDAKEKFAGIREKMVCGGAVPFFSGSDEANAKPGTRGRVNATTRPMLRWTKVEISSD